MENESKSIRNPIIEEIALKMDGYINIARAVNLSKGAVSQWSEVPPAHVLTLERECGISRHRMRPDIFGEAEKAA